MNRILVGALMAMTMAMSGAAAETFTFRNSAEGAPPEIFELWRTGGGAAGQWAVGPRPDRRRRSRAGAIERRQDRLSVSARDL
jgi:hypothetical protein